MDFKELCSLRFSARGYTSDDITDQQLSYILECARLSPSAVNRQPWRFYVVKSPDMKAELHRCYNREWFTSAPLTLCVAYATMKHGFAHPTTRNTETSILPLQPNISVWRPLPSGLAHAGCATSMQASAKKSCNCRPKKSLPSLCP